MRPPPHKLRVEDWGRTSYDDALERQKELVADRLSGRTTDTLVLTEHEPVYTIGSHPGSAQHLLRSPASLVGQGISLTHTNRGGDITCHSPGQLVGYAVLSLAHQRDLHAYLRFLETVILCVLARFDLKARRRDGKTGIWIEDRKIAAIGVAVRRWVTYHGFAINCTNDLSLFDGIVPCGIAPKDGSVTSLAKELGKDVPSMAAVKHCVVSVMTDLWAQALTKHTLVTNPGSHAAREKNRLQGTKAAE